MRVFYNIIVIVSFEIQCVFYTYSTSRFRLMAFPVLCREPHVVGATRLESVVLDHEYPYIHLGCTLESFRDLFKSPGVQAKSQSHEFRLY